MLNSLKYNQTNKYDFFINSLNKVFRKISFFINKYITNELKQSYNDNKLNTHRSK